MCIRDSVWNVAGGFTEGPGAQTIPIPVNLNADVVDTIELVNGAVTADKLLGQPTTPDLMRAVTSNHIRDMNVTTTKIADLNVTEGKLADASVTRAKIGSDAVDGTKIADDAIGNEHIADNACLLYTSPSPRD